MKKHLYSLVLLLVIAFVNTQLVSAQDAPVTTSATTLVRLEVQQVNLNDIWPTNSGVRRNLGISIADYFNDDVFSTVIETYYFDREAQKTVVEFTVKKGGFVRWGNGGCSVDEILPDGTCGGNPHEIAQIVGFNGAGNIDDPDSDIDDEILGMALAPIFYSLIARNLRVEWPGTNTAILQCASTAVCTASDLFGFIEDPNTIAAAQEEFMKITVCNWAQPSEDDPESNTTFVSDCSDIRPDPLIEDNFYVMPLKNNRAAVIPSSTVIDDRVTEYLEE